jgi:hypothetical protein
LCLGFLFKSSMSRSAALTEAVACNRFVDLVMLGKESSE